MNILRYSQIILLVIILFPTLSFSQLTLKHLKDRKFKVKDNYKIVSVPHNVAVEDYDNDGFQDFAEFEANKLIIYKCIGKEYVISFEKEFDDEIEKINWIRSYPYNGYPFLEVYLRNNDKIIIDKNLIYRKDRKSRSILYNSDEFQKVWEYSGTLETYGYSAVGDVNNNDTLDATYIEGLDYYGVLHRLKIFESSGDNQYRIIYSLTDSIGDAGCPLTDFDNNGRKEIILFHITGWLHLLEYDGRGNYILYGSTLYYLYGERYLRQVIETDIDKDGIKEAVLLISASGIVTGPNTYIMIAEFQGKESGPEFWEYNFTAFTHSWLEYDCYAGGIAAGDIDGDGTDEIVIGTPCSNGDSIPYFDYDQSTRRFTLKHLPNHYPYFGAITKPMIFDFDGDGMKELIGTGAGFYVIKSTGLNQFQTVFFDSVDKRFTGNTGIATVQLSINHGLINGSEITAVGSDYYVIENGYMVDWYSRVYSFKNYGINNYQRYWISELIDTGRIFSVNIADMDKDRKESFIFPLQLSRGKILDYEKTTVSNIENHNTENEIENFELSQNYPNPFNSSTTISFKILKEEFVELSVYDVLGRTIKVLISELVKPGNHHIKFRADSLISGVYFYRIKTPKGSITKKMLYLK